jgi:hypothetical protein
MAVAKKDIRRPAVGYPQTIAGQQAEARNKAGKAMRVKAKATDGEGDYNGMPLDEWKIALTKDVEERFGPAPEKLAPKDKAGW